MLENPNQGHRQRLKNRFRKQMSLEQFEPHNILELLLFYSISRKDTNRVAHELLKRFGSISAVFDAPYDELLKTPGIGEQSALLLKMVAPLSNVYLTDKCRVGTLIRSSEEAGHYFLPRFVGKTEEEVWMISLDGKGRLLDCSCLHKGSFNAVQISVRNVVTRALQKQAVAVIVAHNHPDGVALPSDNDIFTTQKMVSALSLVGVRLMDHILVAGDDFVCLSLSAKYADLFL